MADEKKKDKLSRPSVVLQSNKSRSAPSAPAENTYRLQPPRIYNRWKVEPLIQSMLEDALKGEKYNPENIRAICRDLTHSVKNKVVAMNYRRYKIVVTTVIGQASRGGGIQVGSRALMQMNFDGYASATLVNNDIFATLLVYFLNFE